MKQSLTSRDEIVKHLQEKIENSKTLIDNEKIKVKGYEGDIAILIKEFGKSTNGRHKTTFEDWIIEKLQDGIPKTPNQLYSLYIKEEDQECAKKDFSAKLSMKH